MQIDQKSPKQSQQGCTVNPKAQYMVKSTNDGKWRPYTVLEGEIKQSEMETISPQVPTISFSNQQNPWANPPLPTPYTTGCAVPFALASTRNTNWIIKRAVQFPGPDHTGAPDYARGAVSAQSPTLAVAPFRRTGWVWSASSGCLSVRWHNCWTLHKLLP